MHDGLAGAITFTITTGDPNAPRLKASHKLGLFSSSCQFEMVELAFGVPGQCDSPL